jgi:transcription antitermination factor NusB
MRKRSQAREFALQILYQMDITREGYEAALSNFWQLRLTQDKEEVDPQIKSFAENLVKGAFQHKKEIDEKISRFAANWDINRMAVVDRNILRMASYELVFCDEIPPKVSINEAIDLAKKYSGIKAGQFVNGILDKIRLEKT